LFFTSHQQTKTIGYKCIDTEKQAMREQK